MAIDESAGVRYRKDGVVKSAAQSYALARLLEGPIVGYTIRITTFAALARRGWAERREHPEVSRYAFAWHLTDAGRAVALASPAVREWIDDWEYYRKRREAEGGAP